MICQVCGVEAPTRKVEFHRVIGMLVVMQLQDLKGNMCKECILKTWLNWSGLLLLFGWWGLFSFFLTILFLITNTIQYLMSLSMDPPAPNATAPELTDAAIERLTPLTEQILSRLNEKKAKLEDVATIIAPQANVTPGQVMLYVYALAAAQQAQRQAAAPPPKAKTSLFR